MRKERIAVLSGLGQAEAARVELLLLAMGLDVELTGDGRRDLAVMVAAADADRAAELIREEFPYGVGAGGAGGGGVYRGPGAEDASVLPEAWFGRGTAIIVFLVAACVLVFVSLAADGGATRAKLLEHGAINWALVEEGQHWRLLSAVFVHFDIRHLVANMATFILLGPPLAHSLGPRRFLLLFLVAGVAGNVLSHELAPTVGLKAGASGAIAGVLGGLAGARLRPGPPSRFRSWQVLGALAAVYGMVVGFGPGRDNVAHLGGLFSGLLLGRMLEPEPFDPLSSRPQGGVREPRHRFR